MVDFMLRFVEQALHYHFNSSLSAVGNKILDPFAGTGSFLARLCSDDLNLIPTKNLLQKFSTDIFALELQPLAFYGCQINLQYTLQNRLDNIEFQQINHHILLADT